MAKNTSGVLSLLAGIWLIISPFIMDYASMGVSATQSVILGIIVGILAIVRMSSQEAVWASWLNLIAGLWLIISPFVLGYGDVTSVVANSVIVGLIVGATAIAGVSTRTMQTHA